MDYDAEDEKRKRKHMELHREYSQAHDSDKNPAADENEQARGRRPLHDLDRLRGRGNGPVRIAMMEGLQQTHGNRAVQRFFASGNPLAGVFGSPKGGGSAKGGSTIGTVAGGIIAGITEALGNLSPRDPMVENMWRSAVITPIQTAVTQLQNVHGSEADKIETLKEIRDEIRNARQVVREIKEMIEESGVNPTLVARLKADINGLVAVEAGISTHIPEKEDPSAARSMLEMYIDEAKALGDTLIEESPQYNPATHKPVRPARPAADNPMASKLWNSTVVQPLEKAIKRLKGHPTNDQLREALEEVGNARRTIEGNLLIMLMGKPAIGARVDKVSQYLLVVMRILQDKLGKEVSLEELSGELTMRGIPMEYMVDEISMASGQIAAAAQNKKSAGADDATTDTK